MNTSILYSYIANDYCNGLKHSNYSLVSGNRVHDFSEMRNMRLFISLSNLYVKMFLFIVSCKNTNILFI